MDPHIKWPNTMNGGNPSLPWRSKGLTCILMVSWLRWG